MVPIDAILGIHRRTRYAHAVHTRGTIVRGRPEVAIRAQPVRRSAKEETGNRRRQHGLKTEKVGSSVLGGGNATYLGVEILEVTRSSTYWEFPAFWADIGFGGITGSRCASAGTIAIAVGANCSGAIIIIGANLVTTWAKVVSNVGSTRCAVFVYYFGSGIGCILVWAETLDRAIDVWITFTALVN